MVITAAARFLASWCLQAKVPSVAYTSIIGEVMAAFPGAKPVVLPNSIPAIAEQFRASFTSALSWCPPGARFILLRFGEKAGKITPALKREDGSFVSRCRECRRLLGPASTWVARTWLGE